MAIAFVQSVSADAGVVLSAGLAFVSNNTAGNAIITGVRYGAVGRTVTMSDSRSNTYAQAITGTGGVDGFIHYASNIGAGANTVTATISGTPADTLRWAIHEYSGLAATNMLDQVNQGTGTSTTPDSGNVTTTVGNELVFGVLAANPVGATTTATAGSGYTIRENLLSGTQVKIATEDKILSTTATTSASFTYTASDQWECLIATFRMANPHLLSASGAGG